MMLQDPSDLPWNSGDLPITVNPLSKREEDLIQLIYWLASVVSKQQRCRLEAIALPPDQCKEHIMMQFATVQGLSLQMLLESLGSRSTDRDRLQSAIDFLRKHNDT